MNLADLKWTDVAALSRDMPVVIPIAALEQHGRHMPVFTDSMLLGEVIRRASEPLKDRALFTPLMWLGNSEHHLDFPGTMSAAPRLYLDLLRDMAENFLFHDFKRIVFINGHGGNIVPSHQVVYELRQKYRGRSDLLLLASTYWTLGGKPYEAESSMVQRRMGHACEWETSMMLRLAPHLVGDLDRVPDVDWGNSFEPANRGWTMKDRSEPGHVGFPKTASAEKGEILFRTFAADVVALLERVVKWDGKSWEG
jgi:creatinine amidohydrolase